MTITTQQRLTDYNSSASLGYRMRRRRSKPIRDLIEQTYQKQGSVSLLDIGGREAYWRIMPPGFLEEHRVTITLVNLPTDMAGIDSDRFLHRVGNACDMKDFADNQFDIVHSNSVIEHVGSWQNVKAFAREANRLAPRHFIQTPYFWFPVEPHYVMPLFHWLPRPLQESILMRRQMGQRKKAPNRDTAIHRIQKTPWLLDINTMRLLFPHSQILKERFCLLVKSIIAYRE